MSSRYDKVVWIVALQSSRSRIQSTELLLRKLAGLAGGKEDGAGWADTQETAVGVAGGKGDRGSGLYAVSRSTVSRSTHSTNQENIRSELVWCEVYDCVQCEKRPEHFCTLGIDMARVDLACEALALETR